MSIERKHTYRPEEQEVIERMEKASSGRPSVDLDILVGEAFENVQRADTCFACRFFRIDAPDAYLGQCRRYAPRPGQGTTTFPTVNKDEWCGEHQSKHEVTNG